MSCPISGKFMVITQKARRSLISNLTGYFFILPNIIGALLFTIIPMLYSLVISFTDWDYTKGFGNYNFIVLISKVNARYRREVH